MELADALCRKAIVALPLRPDVPRRVHSSPLLLSGATTGTEGSGTAGTGSRPGEKDDTTLGRFTSVPDASSQAPLWGGGAFLWVVCVCFQLPSGAHGLAKLSQVAAGLRCDSLKKQGVEVV